MGPTMTEDSIPAGNNAASPLPRWPLFVIAAPAAVAVWSG